MRAQLWYAATGVLPPDFPLRPVQAALGLAMALTITILIPRDRGTAVWAVALLVPAAWLMQEAIPAVMGLFRFL